MRLYAVGPKHYALGRLKAGQMNKTEAAYAQTLELRKRAGEIIWYAFDAINLRLAEKTHYRGDFFVMLASGELQVHEVKGARSVFADDAKVKVKVAASLFPFKFIVVYPQAKKPSGGWEYEEF